MASYNSNQLYGAGAPIEALTGGSTYTFTITSPISSSLNISIGQNFQGGKLAYILTSSDAGYDPSLIKGIIAADADEATMLNWNNAITAAENKTTNDYTDWYLPNLNELYKLYLNKVAIGGFENSGTVYWSSEAVNTTQASYINFFNGLNFDTAKSSINNVRAIRQFSIPSNIYGPTYFTLETVRNSMGYYGSTSATTARGTFGNLTNVTGLVSSSYIFSVVVQPGGGSFTFTPAANVAVSGSFLRGTGGISLTIS